MIRKYEHHLIVERFDKNIRAELLRLGVDKDEIGNHIKAAKHGNLGKYVNDKGSKFTFGLLNAIFKDAIDAKKNADLKVGFVKMVHRITPMLIAPFFPMLAIIGYILGTSRAFNKILVPILSDPGNEYSGFLRKIIDTTMKISEGEISLKDRFSRAFVISDNLTEAIKPEVLRTFSLDISEKMSKQDPDAEVPDHYIENQFKTFLNNNYEIDPKIPLKD